MENEQILKIPKNHGEYPEILKHIHNPPENLYIRGGLQNGLLPIAIVGSRKMSTYGKQAVEFIVSGLQGFSVSIISGLAFGVDAQAHQSALQHGIHTVAVLGSGIDDQSIYPRANRGLANEILSSGGAIISEYPEGTKALDYHFPNRNRIISGISKCIIIIEADFKSGSLITAKFALEQNRDVFAVPGSIFQLKTQT